MVKKTTRQTAKAKGLSTEELLEQTVAIRTQELERTKARLEEELQNRQSAEQALALSEEKFHKAFMASPDPMALSTMEEGRFVEVNQAFLDITGLKIGDVIGKTSTQLGLWKDAGQRQRIMNILKEEGRLKNAEITTIFQGKERLCLYSAETIHIHHMPHLVTSVKDITDLKNATRDLSQKDQELEIKSRQLQEVNDALRILLSQSKDEMKKLEQRIVINVEELIMPYVARMKETPLSVDQTVYMSVIESNLKEVVAPFMRTIVAKHPNLTPREIEVANLVRMGASSKEAAKVMGISKRAVEFHRDSLRNKLGLKNRKRNLRAYLSSMN
ncbi:MAG: PAS domain S-box protein [Desulfatibacillaceae bacterium]|nr:PAS domain S-box protein [Desulfatibacillaceae bacterium]